LYPRQLSRGEVVKGAARSPSSLDTEDGDLLVFFRSASSGL